MPSDCWNAWALPWKLVWIVGGSAEVAHGLLIGRRGLPSATPWPRLKLIVTAGNWPWWLIDSGRIGSVDQCATAESGTMPPVAGALR